MDNDTISRQAALRELHLLAIEALRKQRYDYNALITICSNKLRDLPAIQPKQKTGRWIEQTDTQNDVYYVCSNCKEAFTLIEGTDNLYNYCPNCGAKIKSEVTK